MFAPKYDATKLKLNLKLVITRLQMLQKKKEAMSILERKKIAEFLRNGKDELARIKVEQIIRDDYLVESYELLEMYCSLLSTRFGLIEAVKECDRGIEEAVTTIIWASARVHDEVPELKAIANGLALRYGNEFARFAMENRGNVVNARVIHKLSVSTPEHELVDGYLRTIAIKYNVDWTPPERHFETPVGQLIDTPAPCDCPTIEPQKFDFFPAAPNPLFPPATTVSATVYPPQYPPASSQSQYPPQYPPAPISQPSYAPPPASQYPPQQPNFSHPESSGFVNPGFSTPMAPSASQPQPQYHPPADPAASGDGPSFEELNRRFEMLKQQK